MRDKKEQSCAEDSFSVAIVTNSPPGTSGRVIVRALVKNLRGCCNAGELFVESAKKVKSVEWNSEPPERLLTHFSENLKYIQLHLKIPRYDLYQYISHNYLELARWRRPAVAMIFDILPLQIEGLSSPGTVERIKRRMRALQFCSRIVAISDATRKALREFCSVEEKRIDVVYPGVDLLDFQPQEKQNVRERLGLPVDRRIVLSVGAETPNRNVARVVRAFEIVSKRLGDVILLRVGAISPQITKLIYELGLESRVVRAGQIGDSIRDYYCASDVFLSLDLGSGFGLPNLEAMACGCPVLCSNTGAFPEVVADAAVLTNPLEIEDSASKMIDVLESPAMQENLRQKGFARARKFTWQKTADSMFEIYRRVLDR